MPALQARVAARGFNSTVVDGYTGAGALESQGGPQDPEHGQALNAVGAQTLPGFAPEGPAAPSVPLLEGMWGVPGTADTDHTPRTHAAPVAPWAGGYNGDELVDRRAEADAIHSADFGNTVTTRTHSKYALPEPSIDQWSNENRGSSNLEKVTGQLRAMGSGDIDQGYSRANGYGFDAGHRARTTIEGNVVNAYLDPAERAFVVPQASGTFEATDAVQGPLSQSSTYLAAPSIHGTPQTAYTPPVEDTGAPVAPVGAPASVGWWR